MPTYANNADCGPLWVHITVPLSTHWSQRLNFRFQYNGVSRALNASSLSAELPQGGQLVCSILQGHTSFIRRGCLRAGHVREQLSLACQAAEARQRAEAAVCRIQQFASVALAPRASMALALCWTLEAAASPPCWSTHHCVHSCGFLFVVHGSIPCASHSACNSV